MTEELVLVTALAMPGPVLLTLQEGTCRHPGRTGQSFICASYAAQSVWSSAWLFAHERLHSMVNQYSH